jgi:hypothetical protein
VARRCLAFFWPAGLQDLEFWNDRILERSSVEELLMLRRLAGFLFLSAALVHAANSGGPQPLMAKERALPVVPTAGLVFEF